MADNKSENRTIVISDVITPSVAKFVIERIVEFNNDDRMRENDKRNYKTQPINIIINTPGGSVTDGFAIIAAIRTSATHINTICFGRAMSMGFAIFAAGHKRFAHRLSLFMYHDLSANPWGKLEDLKDSIEYCEMLVKMGDEVILERTRITKDQLESVRKERRDWFLTADDAVKLGLADEIAIERV